MFNKKQLYGWFLFWRESVGWPYPGPSLRIWQVWLDISSSMLPSPPSFVTLIFCNIHFSFVVIKTRHAEQKKLPSGIENKFHFGILHLCICKIKIPPITPTVIIVQWALRLAVFLSRVDTFRIADLYHCIRAYINFVLEVGYEVRTESKIQSSNNRINNSGSVDATS